MNKEQLLAAGFTEDQATSILKMHKEAIDGNFIAKHRFDEVNGQLKTAKEQVTERDGQIAGLKKFEGDSATLSEKIKALEEANTLKDKEYNTKLAVERKRNAVKLALLEDETGKPHDADMVMGLFNLDTVVIDEATGKITSGYKEQNDSIRKEKTFLFTAKEDPATGKPAGWKPKGNEPGEGDKGAGKVDPSVALGKSFAQIKLGMMGVKAPEAEK